jgi:hypothetical protein
MFLFSVRMRSNFSPARNVLSTTEPVLELDDAPRLAVERDVHPVPELVG